MKEIDFWLNYLGAAGVAVVAIILLWKYVFKSLFEIWLKGRVDLARQEVSNALAIQKDLALKKAEFEAVKIARVLPLLESINGCVHQHSLLFSGYIQAVANKVNAPDKYEELRVDEDEKFIALLPQVGIYLPKDFRDLLYCLRRSVSCSWKPAASFKGLFEDYGLVREVLSEAQIIHYDLLECFYVMSNKYLGVSDDGREYLTILNYYGLNQSMQLIDNSPLRVVAWNAVLFSEYADYDDLTEAQEKLLQGPGAA